MPANYKQAGTDFDSLFDPYVQGTKPAATGYKVEGVDLSDRYAPISFGTKRADVGFKVGGSDVSNLWAGYGTAVYFPTTIEATSQSLVGAAASASVGIAIKTNGTIVVSLTGTTSEAGEGTYNYVPTASGASASYDFRVRGTVAGSRGSGASGTLTGKGGVSYSAATGSGSTAAFDTGWITTADDSSNFLTLSCSSPANVGSAQLDIGGVAGSNMIIEVRRKSDSVVIFSSSTAVQCISDSQS